MTDPYYSEALTEIDPSLIKDFIDEFNDMYELTINAIAELEDPKKYNLSLINSVFRGIHSIKSNLRIIGLTVLSEIVHHLENILEQVRQGQQPYMPEYGDIIRLVLDETKIAAEKYFKREKDPISENFKSVAHVIEHIYNNQHDRKEAVEIVLKLLNPFNKETQPQQPPAAEKKKKK